MLLKVLFFAIILYFALRAVANIARALMGERGPARDSELHRDRRASSFGNETEFRNGNAHRDAATPRARSEAEIEDARWVDVTE